MTGAFIRLLREPLVVEATRTRTTEAIIKTVYQLM